MVKAEVETKEDTWKEVLEGRNEVAKYRCMKVYREILKSVYITGKR